MKKGKLLLSFLLVIVFAICAFACEDVPKYTLSFLADGKVVHSVSTTGVEGVTMPADPTKKGYTFDGWFYDKDTFAIPFTLEKIVATPIKADTTVHAKFTVLAVLSSIAVTTKPTKLRYAVGENFDSSGIVVTGTYDNSSVGVIPASDYTVDSAAYNNALGGEYIITVKSTKNTSLKATFTVSVEKKAASVAITTAAAKTSFNISEDFSANGLAITLAYDDGTKKQLAASEYTIDSTAYNKARGGEYPISISLKENAAIKLATPLRW